MKKHKSNYDFFLQKEILHFSIVINVQLIGHLMDGESCESIE